MDEADVTIAVIKIPRNNCVGLEADSGLILKLPNENGKYGKRNPNILALYDTIRNGFHLNSDEQLQTFLTNGATFYNPQDINIKLTSNESIQECQ